MTAIKWVTGLAAVLGIASSTFWWAHKTLSRFEQQEAALEQLYRFKDLIESERMDKQAAELRRCRGE